MTFLRILGIGTAFTLSFLQAGNTSPLNQFQNLDNASASYLLGYVSTKPLDKLEPEAEASVVETDSGQQDAEELYEIPLTIEVFRPRNSTPSQRMGTWIQRMEREFIKASDLADQIYEACLGLYDLRTETGFNEQSNVRFGEIFNELNGEINKFKKGLDNAQKVHYRAEFDNLAKPLRSYLDSMPGVLDQYLLTVNETYLALKEENYFKYGLCQDDTSSGIFFLEGISLFGKTASSHSDESNPDTHLTRAMVSVHNAYLEWIKFEASEYIDDVPTNRKEISDKMQQHLKLAATHLNELKKTNKSHAKKARSVKGYAKEVYLAFSEIEKSFKRSIKIENNFIKEFSKVAKALKKTSGKPEDSRSHEKYLATSLFAQLKYEELNSERELEMSRRMEIAAERFN